LDGTQFNVPTKSRVELREMDGWIKDVDMATVATN